MRFRRLIMAVAIYPVSCFRRSYSVDFSPTTTRRFVCSANEKQASTFRFFDSAVALRGGGSNADFVDDAYGWVTNLGAPSALVAGAVIGTLYESMSDGSLDVRRSDKAWVRLAKKVTRLLLLSAFILQVICIFCTTILGTNLLSRPVAETSEATSALDYLRQNYEFEYLTSRISFLQGLLNWLFAIAVEHAIPQGPHESEARRRMDLLIASSLTTLMIAMVSFYNGHMEFYANYGGMLCRYFKVMMLRFIWQWPPRIMTAIALLPFAASIYYFFEVFFELKEEDKKVK